MVEERDLPRPLLRHRLAGAIRHERVATIVGHGRGTRPAAITAQRAVVAGLVPRPCPTGLRARSLCDAFSTKPGTVTCLLRVQRMIKAPAPKGAKVCSQGREPLGTVRANRQAQRATDSAIGLHPHSQTSARRAPSRQVSCLDRALPYSGGATTASLSTTRADHGLPRGRCALL